MAPSISYYKIRLMLSIHSYMSSLNGYKFIPGSTVWLLIELWQRVLCSMSHMSRRVHSFTRVPFTWELKLSQLKVFAEWLNATRSFCKSSDFSWLRMLRVACRSCAAHGTHLAGVTTSRLHHAQEALSSWTCVRARGFREPFSWWCNGPQLPV